MLVEEFEKLMMPYTSGESFFLGILITLFFIFLYDAFIALMSGMHRFEFWCYAFRLPGKIFNYYYKKHRNKKDNE